MEVLKDRLTDALYEAEKQRLEIRSKNEELAGRIASCKKFKHIIDNWRNNHTFSDFNGNRKKGMDAKALNQLVFKNKRLTQQIDRQSQEEYPQK